MSGGIAQLVAIGAQDAHLVGQPEVSFFRSNYKRHTNFAQTVERQVIQGNPVANGMSTVRFERKGDMLGYVYISNRSADITNWANKVAKVELLIGGQVIDDQTDEFIRTLAPVTTSQTYSKYKFNNQYFYPLKFSFCENAQSAIPLVALQYHDVELRITWGSSATDDAEVYAQFIHLDTDERTVLSAEPQNMLITQTQKSIKSSAKTQEINFNHPMKYLVAVNGMVASKAKLQINGTDVTDAKAVRPHFTSVPVYYHTQAADTTATATFLQPFCLDTSKLQPTGSLNFSRLDSARLVSDNESWGNDIYGVNYNILRIENGMGGLMYSN
ncbi:MAG: hypothetical protein CMP10_00220 [Zetaproteobacteria bacterium]|jgi:hypothetical protein|nr:hypothetical protein [Pseudobdellovibrionaceae bacterium]